jgi:hypothetical protein
MKMRIKGNSLRLRITRSELARLDAGECVVETTKLSAAQNGTLSYSLKGDASVDEMTVNYQPGRIDVLVPVAEMRAWCGNDEVGVYAVLDVGDGESLEFSVEKDYACLDRSVEDNEDTFANPRAGKAC